MNSPELRTMNETTASIAGKEIGRALIERYYPELLPPPTPANAANPNELVGPLNGNAARIPYTVRALIPVRVW